MKHVCTTAAVAVVSVTLSLSTVAKVSQEQADKLGGPEFTPVGAERAGNTDGTIPEWSGGITETPPGIVYKIGDFHPNPFADEKPLFTITPDNVAEYADKLSPGQLAMFEKYDTYKMNVYPTHRTAAMPQYVYDGIKYNALNAEAAWETETTSNTKVHGMSPKGAVYGSPFPFPKDGGEVMINHTYRFNGRGLREFPNQLVVTAKGDYILAEIEWDATHHYSDPNKTPEEITEQNMFRSLFQFALAPARIAGGVLVGTGPITPSQGNGWSYNPGQRRVRRAPQIAYDNPGTGSDGLRFTDNYSGFLGNIDRYKWDLQGKKEMYIAYNAYDLHSDKITYDDIVRPHHINQDLARYELHRVWVVDANIRSGTSHSLARRTHYFDEDSWLVVLADLYDKRQQLWRFQEEHLIQYWEIPIPALTLETVHDLQSGRYICMGADNESGMPPDRNWHKEAAYYNPSTLKGKARR